jgi:hypothetical protein
MSPGYEALQQQRQQQQQHQQDMYLYCASCAMRYETIGGNTFCKECGKKLTGGAAAGYSAAYATTVWTDWEQTEAAAKEAIAKLVIAGGTGGSTGYTDARTGAVLGLGESRGCASLGCGNYPCDATEVWCPDHSGGYCVHCAAQLPLVGDAGHAPSSCPQCNQPSPYPLQTPEFAATFAQVCEEHAQDARERTKSDDPLTWDSSVVNRHK